jgi:peptide/nickel transport system permease protein
MNTRLSEAIKIVLGSSTGKAGVGMLLGLFAISAYVLVSYWPFWEFGDTKWSAPLAWANNPKAVPPAWTNLLGSDDRVVHTTLTTASPDETEQVGSAHVRRYRLPLDFDFSEPPSFVSLTLSDITFRDRPPLITLTLLRPGPEGGQVTLYRYVPPGARPGEDAPVTRHRESPRRVLLSADESARRALVEFHNQRFGTSFTERDLRGLVDQAMFGVPKRGDEPGFDILPGEYEFAIQVTASNPEDSLGSASVVVGGSVFGLMGTDSLGRDLAVGLLFGFPVALFIGLLASTLTTFIGASLGIISGYMGGWVDTVIQRMADIVGNIPVLPILIFMVFIFGSQLLFIILLLVAFGWPGLTILIRSMVLQLRSGQFVEASVALGASRRRIMLRHIFPQVAPFVFAQMIFFTPAAILAEAGLSFLGLGDPSIPTWGQILEQGFRTGAVYVGYWWWVLPPGLLIVLTAVTFALLALALEPAVNPRLRGGR